jgi:hypothetical protein
MKTKIGNDIFYSLNVADLQFVAQQELQRNLNENEIKIVKDVTVSQINWYDAIANAILEGTSK